MGSVAISGIGGASGEGRSAQRFAFMFPVEA